MEGHTSRPALIAALIQREVLHERTDAVAINAAVVLSFIEMTAGFRVVGRAEKEDCGLH